MEHFRCLLVQEFHLLFGQSSHQSALEQQVSRLTALVEAMAAMQMQHMQAAGSPTLQPGVQAAATPVPSGLPLPGAVFQSSAQKPMEQDDPVAMNLETVKKKGVKLPNELLMKMKSESAKFGKALKNLSRTRTHRQKLEQRFSDLLSGKIPPGIRPWKCNDESPIWRLPLGGEAAATMPFKIDGDTTIEEVKKILSVEFHTLNTIADLRFEQLKLIELEKSCSLDLFITKCVALAEPFNTSLSATTSNLGVPPSLCGGWIDEVKCEAVKFYKWQVEAAARDSQKLKEQADRQTKQQKDVLDKAAKLTPHEVVGKAVAAVIQKPNQRAKNKDKVDYVGMLKLDVQEPSLLDQKNGLSPQAAGGPNKKDNKSTTKSKNTPSSVPAKGTKVSKGKGKGAKGSGKGKSKGNEKGSTKNETPKKGSGKGKGDGQGCGRGHAGAKGSSRR